MVKTTFKSQYVERTREAAAKMKDRYDERFLHHSLPLAFLGFM
jgi:hypothetical protein